MMELWTKMAWTLYETISAQKAETIAEWRNFILMAEDEIQNENRIILILLIQIKNVPKWIRLLINLTLKRGIGFVVVTIQILLRYKQETE